MALSYLARLGGAAPPFRTSPRDRVAPAKPALEPGPVRGTRFSPTGPRAMIRAHLRRWRPRPHAQRTGSTPRVRPSGAALQLDPSHRSSQGFLRQVLGFQLGAESLVETVGEVGGRDAQRELHERLRGQ